MLRLGNLRIQDPVGRTGHKLRILHSSAADCQRSRNETGVGSQAKEDHSCCSKDGENKGEGLDNVSEHVDDTEVVQRSSAMATV